MTPTNYIGRDLYEKLNSEMEAALEAQHGYLGSGLAEDLWISPTAAWYALPI